METNVYTSSFLHSKAPNYSFQFEFVECTQSSSCGKHDLMLCDYRSDCKWIFASQDTIDENASKLIIYCSSVFGLLNSFLSDRPTYFRMQMVRFIAKVFVCHIISYTP